MPQGSILGPLLFNIFINDILYSIQGAFICNFADDNSLYSIEYNFKEVKTMLKKKFELLEERFYENHMVLNPGKCHYLIIDKDISNEFIELGKKSLHAKAEQKLLGITIDKDSKPYKVDYKSSKSKVKCPYLSRTVNESFQQKVYN